MKVSETKLPGLIIIEPKVFEDPRGYFFESYNQRRFREAGILSEYVQDNQSKSEKGVLRGLHYQQDPYAQAKLVRVLSGEVLDVAVDLRKGSPTFGKSYSVRLSAENRKQMYIPRGFAHGFVVLSKTAEFFYKCDNTYAPEYEGGLRFDDPDLQIDWIVDKEEFKLSEKDLELPFLKDASYNFEYET